MRTEVARASAKITASRKPTCAALDKQIARQEARVSKLEAEAEEARKQEAARRDSKLASIDADTERRKKENAARLDTRREQRRAKALEREICSPPAPRTPKEERKPKRSLRRSRARVADEGVVTQLKGCDDMCGVAMDQSLVCGAKTTILLSSSGGAPRTIPARFCLVDARTLVPSHDPETFDARPEYPAGVQNRLFLPLQRLQPPQPLHRQPPRPAPLPQSNRPGRPSQPQPRSRWMGIRRFTAIT